MTDDISESENKEYTPKSASTVKGNLIFDKHKEIGDIYSSAYRFSDISDNEVYFLGKAEEIFADINSENYNIRDIDELRKSVPYFQNIHLDETGMLV